MHILEIETFGRGGLAHYAFNLARALGDRGHQVDLLTAADYELGHFTQSSNVRTHPLLRNLSARLGSSWPSPLAALGRKSEALVDAYRAALFANQLKPDLIHLHSTNSSALAYLVALKTTNIPIVTTTHVVTPHESMAFQNQIYGHIHRLPELRIAHSEADRQRLIREFGAPAPGTVVIPHGDYTFFAEGETMPDRLAARTHLGLSDQKLAVLFFGFLREYKGLDLLLDAWPSVQPKVANAQLIVAGDPTRLSKQRRLLLEGQAKRLGAITRFEYVPFKDVSTYFAAADLVVLPYRHISQSGVLYLALASGVPVIATRIGAWREMLKDGENALLVEPENVAALAKSIQRALQNPRLRSTLADSGRQLAAEHAWPRVAFKTEQVFDDQLTRKL
ncbi:MAG: glycosyltransferase family 4 protein [Pseudomonadota bacterium]